MDSLRGYFCPLAFLAVGIVFLGCSGYYWKQADALLQNAVATTGEVILMREEDRHIQPRHQGEAEETYRPVIQFTTHKGRQVQYMSIVSSYPPRYSVGDKVRVLYDPDRPEWARIDDFTDLWLRPVFLAGVGLILAVFGSVSLHTRHKYGWKRANQGYYRGEQ